MCLFAYSSRTDVPICTKLGMLIPWDQEENWNSWNSVLSSIPGEGGSCSSETKHDRRKAPRPKLFVLKRRLQELRPQPRNIILGSSPDKDVFSTSETKQDRMAQRTTFFVSTSRLQELRSQTLILSWVRVSVNMFGLGITFSMILNYTYRMIRPIISFRAIKTDKKCNHLLIFPAATLRTLS
jgi:hypothetical protein